MRAEISDSNVVMQEERLRSAGSAERLRIVFLVPNLDRGGTERQVALLAQHLGRQGHDVTVATFRGAGAFERGLREAKVRLETLSSGRMPQVVASLYNLIRMLRRDSGVVLYSLLPAANFLAALAGLFGRDSRIVWGVRSADLPLERYSAKTRFAYAAEHALCRLPDRIIVNSQAGLEACRRRGYPDLRLRMISNGFDTEMFRPDAEARRRQREVLGLRDGEIAIGLPARIDPVKDHATFLRAAAILLKSGVAARFVCYGGGSKILANELRELAAELGIADHVHWRGEQSDMPQALNALDIATLCSVSEGFPNAVGEAMACGLPCVVTDVGDAGYLVGDSGIVVPPRDPAALAQAWHGLFEPADRRRRGELARARILEQFSVERLAEKTLAVLLDAR